MKQARPPPKNDSGIVSTMQTKWQTRGESNGRGGMTSNLDFDFSKNNDSVLLFFFSELRKHEGSSLPKHTRCNRPWRFRDRSASHKFGYAVPTWRPFTCPKLYTWAGPIISQHRGGNKHANEAKEICFCIDWPINWLTLNLSASLNEHPANSHPIKCFLISHQRVFVSLFIPCKCVIGRFHPVW